MLETILGKAGSVRQGLSRPHAHRRQYQGLKPFKIPHGSLDNALIVPPNLVALL